MPSGQREEISEKVSARYEKLLVPVDSLVKDAQKPGGLGAVAYLNAAQKADSVVRRQEKRGKRNPELYDTIASKFNSYIEQMPQNGKYTAAKKSLRDFVTRYEHKARECRA